MNGWRPAAAGSGRQCCSIAAVPAAMTQRSDGCFQLFSVSSILHRLLFHIKEEEEEAAAAGRSGRAGRKGETITLYTEADLPFLRNIANVMVASGCEVPSWILTLPKLRKRKHRPERDSIAAVPYSHVKLKS